MSTLGRHIFLVSEAVKHRWSSGEYWRRRNSSRCGSG